MAFSCPHCKAEVANVVTQETLTERLKAKDAVIAEQKSAIRELEPLRAAATERDSALAELAKIRTEGERAAAYAGAGVVDDPKVRERLARYHAAEQDGAEAPVPFADWLAADDTRVMFASAFAKAPAAGAAPKTPAPPVTAAKTVTPPAAGDPPPPATAKPTRAQVAADLAAARELPIADRRARVAEIRAQVAATGTAD